MGQNRVDYFVQNGVAFSTQIGSDKRPAITRWTSWGPGDLQQSYLLHTTEGTLVVDPVLPGRSDSLQELKRRAGKVAAIVSLNPLHERHIAEAGRRYRAPVYGPTSAKKTTKYGRKLDETYGDGELLPGGVRAIASEDGNGEMWLHWKAPNGQSALLCADTIYGQRERGPVGGREASYWMQEGGIRLRATGVVERKELRRRYKKLDALDIDLVLNGHNAYPLDRKPKAAIKDVLAKGVYEVHPNNICTFVYMDFS